MQDFRYIDGSAILRLDREACIGCGMCVRQCGSDAITLRETPEGRKARIDHDKCSGCGRCVGACHKQGAIGGADGSTDTLNCKISEYAMAVVQGKPNFHISLVMDVSPFCDCHDENDAAVVPDIGMFASFDPVALDAACAQAVLAAPVIANSRLGQVPDNGRDYFGRLHPETNWKTQLAHAEKIGVGTMKYQLITL